MPAVISFCMDGGANDGGTSGPDVCVIPTLVDFHKANVTRIRETTINNLPLMIAADFVNTLIVGQPSSSFITMFTMEERVTLFTMLVNYAHLACSFMRH